MLKIAGIDPSQRRLMVVKSAVHFRADLGPLADQIFDADTPGIHRPDFDLFQYSNLRRPIHPLDPDVVWKGGT
jgi:microcystin degradation protein MlrC